MRNSPFATMLALLLAVSATLAIAHMPKAHAGLGVSPEIAVFSATPDAIRTGEFVTLSWETRGAVSVTLETTKEGAGPETTEVQRGLPVIGSIKVQPRETTTYLMRCETVFSGSCMPARVNVEIKNVSPQIIESATVRKPAR